MGLSPLAVDEVLNCAHGGKLKLPKDKRTDYLEFVFITATYLKMYDIVEIVKDMAIKEKIRNLNFEEMRGFVNSLPEPMFMKAFPKEIQDLPSRKSVGKKNVEKASENQEKPMTRNDRIYDDEKKDGSRPTRKRGGSGDKKTE